MTRPIVATTAFAAIVLAACSPPPVPPPQFTQYPAYPPIGLDTSNQLTVQDPATDQVAATSQPNPTPPAPQRPGEFPTAQPTTNPNQVVSPYAPHNIIDVEGFTSGQLARDPSNKQIFRVP